MICAKCGQEKESKGRCINCKNIYNVNRYSMFKVNKDKFRTSWPLSEDDAIICRTMAVIESYKERLKKK